MVLMRLFLGNDVLGLRDEVEPGIGTRFFLYLID